MPDGTAQANSGSEAGTPLTSPVLDHAHALSTTRPLKSPLSAAADVKNSMSPAIVPAGAGVGIDTPPSPPHALARSVLEQSHVAAARDDHNVIVKNKMKIRGFSSSAGDYSHQRRATPPLLSAVNEDERLADEKLRVDSSVGTPMTSAHDQYKANSRISLTIVRDGGESKIVCSDGELCAEDRELLDRALKIAVNQGLGGGGPSKSSSSNRQPLPEGEAVPRVPPLPPAPRADVPVPVPPCAAAKKTGTATVAGSKKRRIKDEPLLKMPPDGAHPKIQLVAGASSPRVISSSTPSASSTTTASSSSSSKRTGEGSRPLYSQIASSSASSHNGTGSSSSYCFSDFTTKNVFPFPIDLPTKMAAPNLLKQAPPGASGTTPAAPGDNLGATASTSTGGTSDGVFFKTTSAVMSSGCSARDVDTGLRKSDSLAIDGPPTATSSTASSGSGGPGPRERIESGVDVDVDPDDPPDPTSAMMIEKGEASTSRAGNMTSTATGTTSASINTSTGGRNHKQTASTSAQSSSSEDAVARRKMLAKGFGPGMASSTAASPPGRSRNGGVVVTGAGGAGGALGVLEKSSATSSSSLQVDREDELAPQATIGGGPQLRGTAAAKVGQGDGTGHQRPARATVFSGFASAPPVTANGPAADPHPLARSVFDLNPVAAIKTASSTLKSCNGDWASLGLSSGSLTVSDSLGQPDPKMGTEEMKSEYAHILARAMMPALQKAHRERRANKAKALCSSGTSLASSVTSASMIAGATRALRNKNRNSSSDLLVCRFDERGNVSVMERNGEKGSRVFSLEDLSRRRDTEGVLADVKSVLREYLNGEKLRSGGASSRHGKQNLQRTNTNYSNTSNTTNGTAGMIPVGSFDELLRGVTPMESDGGGTTSRLLGGSDAGNSRSSSMIGSTTTSVADRGSLYHGSAYGYVVGTSQSAHGGGQKQQRHKHRGSHHSSIHGQTSGTSHPSATSSTRTSNHDTGSGPQTQHGGTSSSGRGGATQHKAVIFRRNGREIVVCLPAGGPREVGGAAANSSSSKATAGTNKVRTSGNKSSSSVKKFHSGASTGSLMRSIGGMSSNNTLVSNLDGLGLSVSGSRLFDRREDRFDTASQASSVSNYQASSSSTLFQTSGKTPSSLYSVGGGPGNPGLLNMHQHHSSHNHNHNLLSRTNSLVQHVSGGPQNRTGSSRKDRGVGEPGRGQKSKGSHLEDATTMSKAAKKRWKRLEKSAARRNADKRERDSTPPPPPPPYTPTATPATYIAPHQYAQSQFAFAPDPRSQNMFYMNPMQNAMQGHNPFAAPAGLQHQAPMQPIGHQQMHPQMQVAQQLLPPPGNPTACPQQLLFPVVLPPGAIGSHQMQQPMVCCQTPISTYPVPGRATTPERELVVGGGSQGLGAQQGLGSHVVTGNFQSGGSSSSTGGGGKQQQSSARGQSGGGSDHSATMPVATSASKQSAAGVGSSGKRVSASQGDRSKSNSSQPLVNPLDLIPLPMGGGATPPGASGNGPGPGSGTATPHNASQQQQQLIPLGGRTPQPPPPPPPSSDQPPGGNSAATPTSTGGAAGLQMPFLQQQPHLPNVQQGQAQVAPQVAPVVGPPPGGAQTPSNSGGAVTNIAPIPSGWTNEALGIPQDHQLIGTMDSRGGITLFNSGFHFLNGPAPSAGGGNPGAAATTSMQQTIPTSSLPSTLPSMGGNVGPQMGVGGAVGTMQQLGTMQQQMQMSGPHASAMQQNMLGALPQMPQATGLPTGFAVQVPQSVSAVQPGGSGFGAGPQQLQMQGVSPFGPALMGEGGQAQVFFPPYAPGGPPGGHQGTPNVGPPT